MKSIRTQYSYYTAWRNETGQLHREDGPAVEHSDGHQIWYLNGKRHRVDGPALEDANGYKSWWLNGKSCKSRKEFEQLIKLKAFW